jgi:tetratricopeptide (TPR) repeat protein
MDLADVWVEIGMAYFRMRTRDRAEQYWQRAVRVYPPTCHDHAVARWLLGAAQWFTQAKHAAAISNWKGAINEFIVLADLAEIENRQDDKNWYDATITRMEESLAEAISRRFR